LAFSDSGVETKKASVIVPTYSLERFKDILEAVDSLLQQTFPNKEIIVAVDKNEDLYLKLKDSLSPLVRVVLSTEAGASSARNAGIKMATGDIIAFIDDDVIVNEIWLSMHVRNYKDPNVIGAGGCIKPLWIDCNLGKFPEELYWLIGCTNESYFEKTHEVRNNFGGNFSFRREVFDDLSFSVSFQNLIGKTRGTEDTEFSIRVLKKFPDRKIVYDPEAVAYHKVYPSRMSLKYILKRAYSEGSSKAYIAKLYRGQLSREHSYVRDLFFHFLPIRIKQIVKGKDVASNLRNVLLTLIVVGTTVFGYIKRMLDLRMSMGREM
jgi:glycosyltransferase involved in cell wall biosynthesis